MKAIDITGKPPGGKRIPIAELVPLDTPLLLQIFPIYICNFKCKYCTFSIPEENREFISNIKIMDLNLFKKCIDDSLQFPQKIKVLRFVGMGEPLLHKQLSDMVCYASKSNKFERIEILTNGSLLSSKLFDNLINTGLTKLLISIQGTSEKKYKEISDVTIDFQKFLNNIKYFYENSRNKIQIHIKIIDCALDGEKDKQKFFDIFGNICDTIGIECAGPIYPGVNWNKNFQDRKNNQYSANISRNNICSQSFFSVQINPDGNIVPCYSIAYPEIMGNINTESLYSIWSGLYYNLFRHRMLEGIDSDSVCNTCKHCNIFRHRSYINDNLNSKKEELQTFYGSSKTTN